MTGRVAGKRTAVVGAGSIGPGWGNGKAAAVLYAREGAQVLCVDRDKDAATETASIIRAEGGQADIFAGDMTDPEAALAMASAAKASMGGIDIVHFNVGTSKQGGVTQTTYHDWRQVFAVNLDAAFHVTKATLPLLQQGGGALVYISSLAGLMGGPYSYVGYEASKAALGRFARSVALEAAPSGVRANTVVPGMIDTPHVTALIAGDADIEVLRAARAAQVPLGRQGTAWDIAEAALFLSSDAASFITGAELVVDGGMSGRFGPTLA